MKNSEIQKSEKEKSIDNFYKEKALVPSKSGWSYVHSFGVVHVDSWGNPFLIISERSYYFGVSQGYNYFKLEVSTEDLDQAFKKANELNEMYSLPGIFNGKGSTKLLTKVQGEFLSAKIIKQDKN